MTLYNLKADYAEHTRFRKYYTDHQINISLLAGTVGTVYALICMFIIDKIGTINNEKSSVQSLHLLCYSSVVLIPSLILKLVKWKNDKAKELLSAFTVLVATFVFLTWGFQVMKISVSQGRTTNYIPLLLLYTLCMMMFFFFPIFYWVFYLFCCIGAMLFFVVFPKGNPDYIILFNVYVFGLVITIVGTLRYYSERKREFAERRTRELYESQRVFTSSMNHELRSPLNGIIGSIQVLLNDTDLNQNQKENVINAYQSSHIMLQVVNDLLDYSKMGTSEFSITREEFDFRDVMSDACRTTVALADAKGLSFESSVPDKMPCMFMGDANRIQQIIVNILSNGVKYTNQGGVTINADYIDGKLIVRCADTGQGIPADAMDKLFTPFVRLNEKNNSHIQGTGLGLSIVKNLLDRMGGSVEVESEVGKGSVFTVTIPLNVTNDKVFFGTKKDVDITVSDDEDFSALSVLCIDDMKVNLTVFGGLLKKTGIKLKTAISGKEAIELCNQEQFDIIFTDHQMPEMDGLETFEHIKNESTFNRDTPVYILTANVGNGYDELYRNAGFSGYMTKPVLKSDLFMNIKSEMMRVK